MTAPGFPSSASDLPLSRTRRLGDFTLHAIDAGLQWLDGGAMFGVVPKPLWERRIPADERNRIPLALRCLLVETADELVLIETGLGNKEDPKFMEIYGAETAPREGLRGADRLQAAIFDLGFSPEDVTRVIDTHLHFDHAGGNTFRDPQGQVRIAFPRARYYVQSREWEYAHATNERTRASYLPHNFDPVQEQGLFDLLSGVAEVVPGISVVPTPGHTPFHQSVLIRSGGETACFLGDLVPTMSHLPLAWIMGYDVEPLVTLESKRWLVKQAVDEGWLLVSTHDPRIPWGRAVMEGKSARVVEEE
jgi:glyoxylase-like metal-dependent hydrolase (beta-lactamase superfamily II)